MRFNDGEKHFQTYVERTRDAQCIDRFHSSDSQPHFRQWAVWRKS